MSTDTDTDIGIDTAVASSETPIVARVNYRREGAGDLVRYIEQGAVRGIRDETGRRLLRKEKDRFVERAEQRGFTRSVVLSVPDHADTGLSDRAMDRLRERATERFIEQQRTLEREFQQDHEQAPAVISVAGKGHRIDYYHRARPVSMAGTVPVKECPIEGCGAPATEFLNYGQEVVVLCEDHAAGARNDIDP